VMPGYSCNLGASGMNLSTKLKALVESLTQHVYTSKSYESRPGLNATPFDNSNSIVFSYWTRTLDILCPRLEELGLNYVRVDGNVSRADRTRRLSEFKTSPTIPVLLMAYGTGAVG
jgi:SNF2 family DNA or RNA helicase